MKTTDSLVPTRRTDSEISDLKSQWIKDGCWDIEDTEGFEAHSEELSAWRENYESRQEEARDLLDRKKASEQGLDLDAYRKRVSLNSTAAFKLEEAGRLLCHYLDIASQGKFNANDSDTRSEIEQLVQSIADAGASQALASIATSGDMEKQ